MTFDASEMEVLHDFFRAEAREHLEAMTAALLQLEKNPTPELLDELLRQTHTLKGSAATVGLREVAEAAHRLEAAFGKLRHAATAPPDFDALVQAVDLVKRMVDAAPRRRDDAAALRVDVALIDELMEGVGELAFDRTRIERRVAELRNAARELGRARSGLRALVGEAPEPLAARLLGLEQDFAAEVARMTRVAAALVDDADSLKRTTSALQAGLTRTRMTRVGWLFQRLARPLRDMERSEGKRVEVVTSGDEVELDRAVVERIADPILHMLRNAVAHGIEPPPVRAARGKPPAGRIELSARHQGDSVFLEVADDGGGVDTERIRGRLGRPGASDGEVLAAIFDTGVSAREEADELAGRGVGLDVVREAIVRLGGEIAVRSVAGEGTRFSIRIPFTTALTPAFLFKVHGQVYAVSSAHVVEGAEAAGLPLLSLHRILGSGGEGDEPARAAKLVLDFGGRRFAATCDKPIGTREIVVKSLGPLLAPLPLYAGATISGAGKVQLILDAAALAAMAYPSQAAEPPVPAVRPDPQRARRILVCDDSRTVREALARMLAGEGYVVDQAADGVEAWKMLAEVAYDLVVSDVDMPRLSGVELAERIRARSPLPVVFVSAQGRVGGADAFLAKPVARPELLRTVKQLLG